MLRCQANTIRFAGKKESPHERCQETTKEEARIFTLTFAQEELTANLAIHEIIPLSRDHFEEVDPFPDRTVDVDLTVYENAHKQGMLRIFTARDLGTLVGYAIFIVAKDYHYKDSIRATQDMLYLAPKYRNGFIGVEFIRWCDEQLRAENVATVYQYSAKNPDIGPVFAHLDYTPIQTLWARRFA